MTRARLDPSSFLNPVPVTIAVMVMKLAQDGRDVRAGGHYLKGLRHLFVGPGVLPTGPRRQGLKAPFRQPYGHKNSSCDLDL
jgi:hypothetical protein